MNGAYIGVNEAKGQMPGTTRGGARDQQQQGLGLCKSTRREWLGLSTYK